MNEFCMISVQNCTSQYYLRCLKTFSNRMVKKCLLWGQFTLFRKKDMSGLLSVQIGIFFWIIFRARCISDSFAPSRKGSFFHHQNDWLTSANIFRASCMAERLTWFLHLDLLQHNLMADGRKITFDLLSLLLFSHSTFKDKKNSCLKTAVINTLMNNWIFCGRLWNRLIRISGRRSRTANVPGAILRYTASPGEPLTVSSRQSGTIAVSLRLVWKKICHHPVSQPS